MVEKVLLSLLDKYQLLPGLCVPVLLIQEKVSGIVDRAPENVFQAGTDRFKNSFFFEWILFVSVHWEGIYCEPDADCT